MNRILRLDPALLLLASFCLLPAMAHADIIVYSDLGAGGSYSAAIGYTVSGSASAIGAAVDPAMAFTVGGTSYSLDQIDIALNYVSGTNGSVTVELLNSAGTT